MGKKVPDTFSPPDRNRLIESAQFGLDRKPVAGVEGHARLEWVYDGRDQLCDVKGWDAAGRPVVLQTYVKAVDPGSQAEKLGLKAGDAFVAYNGKPVGSDRRFSYERQAEPKGGAPRELIVLRDGQTLTVKVSPGALGAGLGSRAAPEKKEPPGPEP